MNTEILKISQLSARIENKEILKDINLTIRANEVHAMMGPNGSGKSTLSNLIAGRENYEITSGTITYLGKNLFDFTTDQRARLGIFLGFQYPVEIPGVSMINLLKASVNERRKEKNEPEIDAMDFLNLVKNQLALVDLEEDFLFRSVNTGFSGGEKKRAEILQMALLQPHLTILDEIDSGLDIDALKIIAKAVNQLRNKDLGIIMVTHYQRLLDYITPDYIHVLVDGKIIKSGDKELALELEAKGYGWLTENV